MPNWEPNNAEIGTLSIYRDYTENTKEITQTNTSLKPAPATECVCEEEVESTDESKDSRKEKTAKPLIDNSLDKAELVSFEAESPRTQAKKQSQRRTQDSLFILWKERIDPATWKAFINWKAQQAPSSVRDKLAWAYNTLKTNLERTQLSFESFQQEAQSQSQSQNTKLDATPDFKSWELAQHTELAQQYLTKGVLFLKEQPWHPKWVEFVQATMPTFFDEMQGVST